MGVELEQDLVEHAVGGKQLFDDVVLFAQVFPGVFAAGAEPDAGEADEVEGDENE